MIAYLFDPPAIPAAPIRGRDARFPVAVPAFERTATLSRRR
jgi:hypothetical protein